MRILYLINAPGPLVSGAGLRMLRLAAHDADVGRDVCVGAPAGSGVHAAAAARGIASVEVPMSLGLRPARAARRAVAGFAPDIVHAMSLAPAVLAGLLRKDRPCRPCVFVSILVDPMSPLPMERRRFRAAAMRTRNRAMRRYGRRADAIFAVSEVVAEHLRRLGTGGRVVVVPDCVDIAGLRARAAEPIELPEGRPRIGTAAATLVPGKGPDVLLRAFARVLEHHPDAVCLFAGEPDPSLDLVALAESLGVAGHVHLLGFLDDPAPFIAALDIYALASLSEGLNTSVIEAASIGTPVVACRVGGLPEVVEDGRTGLLVAPGDPDVFAGGLMRLLQDPPSAARMAQAGRARAEERFDCRRCDPTEAEYARALAATAPGVTAPGRPAPDDPADA